MKFFVTGRSSDYPRVEQAFKDIKDRGHEIAFEWTTLPMVKPYAENQEKAAEYAEKTLQGLLEADVYIIFLHKDGNGVFTELGVALASHSIKGIPRIFAIGDERGACMFNYHSVISWKKSVKEILDECK